MPNVLVDLETRGFQAARRIAGSDAVERMQVLPGEDMAERPVYNFSLLIDEGRTRATLGFIRAPLVQVMRDELAQRNDAHFAALRFFNSADWDRRVAA